MEREKKSTFVFSKSKIISDTEYAYSRDTKHSEKSGTNVNAEEKIQNIIKARKARQQRRLSDSAKNLDVAAAMLLESNVASSSRGRIQKERDTTSNDDCGNDSEDFPNKAMHHRSGEMPLNDVGGNSAERTHGEGNRPRHRHRHRRVNSESPSRLKRRGVTREQRERLLKGPRKHDEDQDQVPRSRLLVSSQQDKNSSSRIKNKNNMVRSSSQRRQRSKHREQKHGVPNNGLQRAESASDVGSSKDPTMITNNSTIRTRGEESDTSRSLYTLDLVPDLDESEDNHPKKNLRRGGSLPDLFSSKSRTTKLNNARIRFGGEGSNSSRSLYTLELLPDLNDTKRKTSKRGLRRGGSLPDLFTSKGSTMMLGNAIIQNRDDGNSEKTSKYTLELKPDLNDNNSVISRASTLSSYSSRLRGDNRQVKRTNSKRSEGRKSRSKLRTRPREHKTKHDDDNNSSSGTSMATSNFAKHVRDKRHGKRSSRSPAKESRKPISMKDLRNIRELESVINDKILELESVVNDNTDSRSQTATVTSNSAKPVQEKRRNKGSSRSSIAERKSRSKSRTRRSKHKAEHKDDACSGSKASITKSASARRGRRPRQHTDNEACDDATIASDNYPGLHQEDLKSVASSRSAESRASHKSNSSEAQDRKGRRKSRSRMHSHRDNTKNGSEQASVVSGKSASSTSKDARPDSMNPRNEKKEKQTSANLTSSLAKHIESPARNKQRISDRDSRIMFDDRSTESSQIGGIKPQSTLLQFDPNKDNLVRTVNQSKAKKSCETYLKSDGTQSKLEIADLAELPTFEKMNESGITSTTGFSSMRSLISSNDSVSSYRRKPISSRSVDSALHKHGSSKSKLLQNPGETPIESISDTRNARWQLTSISRPPRSTSGGRLGNKKATLLEKVQRGADRLRIHQSPRKLVLGGMMKRGGRNAHSHKAFDSDEESVGDN